MLNHEAKVYKHTEIFVFGIRFVFMHESAEEAKTEKINLKFTNFGHQMIRFCFRKKSKTNKTNRE